ncbi:hypothetical protein D8674_006202 [Pyrus ussuriensis x Pyrus communis]|uniref:Uncharacterized protein n=1 Tax=Pyrus ussuriensis x Pyrus communis TaxID=2448454 RepID=A0A5N5FTP0_9ROSA|nr:hypothetical protein D8674_006202 [Pyrus ussuriensis x Pyrus communis]
MESMVYTDPSTMVIEELSDEERDVMARTCKLRKRKRLLAIEGPFDNKEASVEEEVTVMCLDDGFHQKEVVGTSVAEIEDVQVVEQVGEQGVQVGEQGEREQSDTFFDVPLRFKGNQKRSDEQDPDKDSDFVESDYGSDEDNPNFPKYDVI